MEEVGQWEEEECQGWRGLTGKNEASREEGGQWRGRGQRGGRGFVGRKRTSGEKDGPTTAAVVVALTPRWRLRVASRPSDGADFSFSRGLEPVWGGEGGAPIPPKTEPEGLILLVGLRAWENPERHYSSILRGNTKTTKKLVLEAHQFQCQYLGLNANIQTQPTGSPRSYQLLYLYLVYARHLVVCSSGLRLS